MSFKAIMIRGKDDNLETKVIIKRNEWTLDMMIGCLTQEGWRLWEKKKIGSE